VELLDLALAQSSRLTIYASLGLVDVTIVPHLPPDGAPDNDFVLIAEQLRRRNLPYSALRDGQAMIVSGGAPSVI
jgi:dipeptidase E